MQIIYTPAEFLRYKPSYWTKEEAIKQAWDVIKEYTKVYMPAAYQRIIDDGQWSLLNVIGRCILLEFVELKTEQETQKRNAESAVARQQDGRTSSRKATNSGVDTSVLRKNGFSGRGGWRRRLNASGKPTKDGLRRHITSRIPCDSEEKAWFPRRGI